MKLLLKDEYARLGNIIDEIYQAGHLSITTIGGGYDLELKDRDLILDILKDCYERNSPEDHSEIDTCIFSKLQDLSDEQVGKVIRYCLEYRRTDVIPDIDDLAIKVAFRFMRDDFDYNWN